MRKTLPVSHICLQIFVTLAFAAQGHEIQCNYKEVEAKRAERSTIECSLRCSPDIHCMAYQFKESAEKNCFVIHRSLAEESEQEFTPGGDTTVFTKDSQSHMKDWSQPDIGNDSDPVVYQNSDDMTGITFYSGDNIVVESVLVLGRISNRVQTDRSLSQYVDLGDLSAACVTKPSTCGLDGGTVSLWMKIIESGFIITSRGKHSEGFSVGDDGTELRYNVAINGTTTRKQLVTNNRPSGWFHMVLVLHGNRGIKVYNKVVQTEPVSTINRARLYVSASGTTVIGKKFTDTDEHYVSVAVDELSMWNRALSETEVAQIYEKVI